MIGWSTVINQFLPCFFFKTPDVWWCLGASRVGSHGPNFVRWFTYDVRGDIPLRKLWKKSTRGWTCQFPWHFCEILFIYTVIPCDTSIFNAQIPCLLVSYGVCCPFFAQKPAQKAVGATWDDENIGDFTEISPKFGKIREDPPIRWAFNVKAWLTCWLNQHGDKLWQDYGKWALLSGNFWVCQLENRH